MILRADYLEDKLIRADGGDTCSTWYVDWFESSDTYVWNVESRIEEYPDEYGGHAKLIAGGSTTDGQAAVERCVRIADDYARRHT